MDTMEEVKVEGVEPPIKKPTAPWKVGLAVGGMTLNPFFGIAAGMIQKMRNKSYLETAAADKSESSDLKGMLDNELKSADPDEKRLLEWANTRRIEAYERLVSGDRVTGEKMLSEVHEALKGIIGGDMAARKSEEGKQNDFKRELVGTAAKGYRQEFQNTTDAFNGMNIQAQKILDLVSDPTFDPNKPLNKAHLAELLSTGNAMFKDTPDMLDGLTQGVTAVNGIAGGIVGGIATAFKSKDFKVAAEDYIKLALNAQKYSKLFAEQNYSRLGSQGASLSKQAQQWGIFAPDMDLHDYISGGETELRMTPNPQFRGGYPSAENEPMRGPVSKPTPTGALVNPQRQSSGLGRGAQRPTN